MLASHVASNTVSYLLTNSCYLKQRGPKFPLVCFKKCQEMLVKTGNEAPEAMKYKSNDVLVLAPLVLVALICLVLLL